ncbi:MAG TPA: Rieske (2Fe-2S) protein [Jatrophihabitantaceae bacterium]|nr:Rieske (2Fe-2S) protein [Jatrophihabitantaceae bacterium]
MDPIVTRRTALAAGAVGVGAVALAACSTSPKDSGGGGSEGGSGGPIVALAKVPVGEAVSAEIDGKPAIVAQPSAGEVAAFSAICTHMGCTVAPAGKELHCPCHGSIYNASTGEVIRGPAPRALAKISVHVANGEVLEGPQA